VNIKTTTEVFPDMTKPIKHASFLHRTTFSALIFKVRFWFHYS